LKYVVSYVHTVKLLFKIVVGTSGWECQTEYNLKKGKGKVVPVPIHHEGIWGNGSIAPPFLTSALDAGEWPWWYQI
jgi:hypothetical protein